MDSGEVMIRMLQEEGPASANTLMIRMFQVGGNHENLRKVTGTELRGQSQMRLENKAEVLL